MPKISTFILISRERTFFAIKARWLFRGDGASAVAATRWLKIKICLALP